MARTKTAKRGGAAAVDEGGVAVNPDHANEFDDFHDDVVGEEEADSDEEDRDKGKKRRGYDDQEDENKLPPYMFFDFRKGSETWPSNVELVDPKRADELLEKATAAAEEAAKKKKKDDDEEGNKKDSGTGTSYSSVAWDSTPDVDEDEDMYKLHPDATFEVLKDGSSALIMKPGYRIRLKLNDLQEGGDEAKEERERKAAKSKKRAAQFAASSSWMGGGGKDLDFWDMDMTSNKKWFKEKINEYTITIDMKLNEEPPRDGISLFQTALIHSAENKRTGKTTLTRSDGECLINQAGGVGLFGTFGDTTRARLEPGLWRRVVVAVKCTDKANDKGEIRTWINTEAGVVLKEESIVANERFSIDPDGFFVFSSAQTGMMPGNISIRTIRVEMTFASDKDVRSNRARDKVLSVFDEERKKEAAEQRKGLCLAGLFPKPRPMWMAPAFVATFGDAFVEKSTLEGSSNLAWSYSVINFALQRMLKNPLFSKEDFGLDYSARVALSDSLHIMQQSAAVFKLMVRMLKTPTESQLLSFLRKLKKLLQAVNVGETLMLPGYVEGGELIILLERTSERLFKVVIVQTDPFFGLRHHTTSPVAQMPHVTYRTCMVLNDVPKKNVLDDVFWMALYNMAIHHHEGDTDKFYDVLIPFLTGKPLEASLVEAENAAAAANPTPEALSGEKADPVETTACEESKESLALAPTAVAAGPAVETVAGAAAEGSKAGVPENCGEWRLPQRSNTAYVRCTLEAFHFLLRRRNVTELQAKQIHLCLCSEMVKMMQNDLHFMLPNQNGVRVCSLAIKELSHMAVQVVDEAEKAALSENKAPDEVSFNGSLILNEVHDLVQSAEKALAYCRDTDAELPPALDLSGPKSATDPQDPALSQFADVPAWDVINTDSDPGQSVAMQKYVPVDLLLIPKKASTLEEAVTAIRICDRQCSLIENQAHCIKNKKFLIVTAIEHVFTQVIPVPKPRGVGLTEEDLHRAGRSQRRAATKQEEEKAKAAEKKKRAEEREEKNITSGGTARKSKLPKKAAEPEAVEAPPVKCFGTEILPDFDEGKKIEADVTDDDCIWDRPVHYELQVELLLSLQRLTEHFAAGAMSLVQSRPFDATCIIVTGCMAAVADALMRKIAVDEPSEMCSHLMGRTVSGRQLGHPGFGISVGTFATQCETLEIHTPELCIARTAVLDYFQSPQQRRLEKIFSWEEEFLLKPGKNLIKYLRLVSKEIGLPIFKPHHHLLDSSPMSSNPMKNYPEFRCYRDIVFWWKYMLNTDRKAFKNYVAEDNTEVQTVDRMMAQLNFSWDEQKNCYLVTAFEDLELHCRPNPNQINPLTGKVIPPEHLPTHRFPSTATPSFYVPAPAIKTEDDVIYRPNLPNFEDQFGQVLNQRDSELLISYLTVPYMRVPLILAFFSSEDRIHKLQSPELRLILDSVMFEPGKYLRVDMCNVEPMMVPSPHPDLLASSYGLLLNELCRSPETVIRSVLSLLRGALACDTGAVVDEDSTTFNTSTTIIIYCTRLGSRVDNYLSFLIDYTEGSHECIDWPLREADVSPEAFKILKEGRAELRELLSGQFHPLFEDYLRRLDHETVSDPTNETLIDRNSRLACDLHAHMLLMYRNHQLDEMTASAAKTLIGSFIYLTTRHTWNKVLKEELRIHLPETELYSLLQVVRRRVVKWLSNCRQGTLDEVMQTALQVSSSLTGSFKASADILDAQNRWSRIQGDRSIGRWAVGSTRNVATSASSGKLSESASASKFPSIKSGADLPGMALGSSSKDVSTPPPRGLQRQASFENDVSEVADTGMLGVEIDVQIGQMTLRSKHLAALATDIANHPDVRMVFGETTMQASLVESAEHRCVYRLVGLNHELHHWRTSHTVCPPLGDEWDREYDPADLGDSEKWMAALFEPVRKSFFDGPGPPPMQFMMTEKPSPADAEGAVILGLHQTIGGPFKLVYLFRRLRCVHVYECVTQGREWFYSLHMSTDYRFALRDMQPSAHHRDQQYPDWWVRGAGVPYPCGVRDFLSNDVTGISLNQSLSVLVVREQQHHLNISGGRETLVPERLLYGVVPHALLDAYRFWEDESLAPRGTKPEDFARASRGYKRLLGYPIEEDGEYMIIVEFKYTGSWTDFIPPALNSNSPNVIQSTGFPGRTVHITRRLKSVMLENFHRRQRVAHVIDSLKILVPPPKAKKAADENDAPEKEEMRFKVDSPVECNYEGKEEWWPCLVRRVNDDNTYDLEFILEYKWLGVQRNVDPAIVQKRGESDKKRRGEGIWHWDGMSASEEDDWRENSDNEKEEEESYEDKEKKQRMTFHQFDELNSLIDIAGGDEEACIAAIKRLSNRFPSPTYTELADLCKAVKQVMEVKSSGSDIGPPMAASTTAGNTKKEKSTEAEDEHDMVLLNLLYAPRRSRLHSILKVLTRIETAGFILAWTKAKNLEKKTTLDGLAYGCPAIDLIELPRLKLAFTARADHEGTLRLYSVDHVDLFITNDSNAMTAKMLAGIPHSLILSNVRGETQVLVPVIPPIRPRISSEPFSTFIVLNRKKIPLAERFFLYPVHISFSFLLTKGLNSALYLMLLRFLHRDYADVFRLSDSIATDTKLNEEGLDIYKSYKSIQDDWHPDAHACRLKISLVTIDSGMKSPWDLTIECARHSVKLDCVSSSCRMAAEEELQLLESDLIVLSSSSKEYDVDKHDEYSMALCYNRQQVLRAQLQQLPTAGPEGVSVSCRAPPRALSTSWPYYQDNTVFGENYMQMREVISVDDGEHSWETEVKGGDETDAPEGGWLVVAVFHTLWSAGCVKVLPYVTELVPMYQNMLNFVSVKADCQGMVAVSKELNVKEFPTFIIFRGGKELERLEGHERVVEKLVRALGTHLTPEDKAAHAKHRHRIRLEKALEQGLDSVPEEEEKEERGQLDWTFDPETCGESMVIEQNGMLVTLSEEQEKDDTQWEYTTDHRRANKKWTPFPPKVNHMIEKMYKEGDLYENGFYAEGYEIYVNDIIISDYEVSGFSGYDKEYNDIYVRRSGDRFQAPGEDQFLTKEQREKDKRSAEWRAKLAAYKLKLKEQRIGKDIEAMRGTIGFLPNTGTHYWTYRWNHEPGRGGKSDGFGVCSDAKEDFSAGPSPSLGGADTGISLALYADGNIYHNGKVICQVQGSRNVVPGTTETAAAATATINGSEDQTDSCKAAMESKEPESTKEEKPKSTDKKKKKADLFGRKSIVRIDFDTALDGGTLTFTVDGKVLEDAVITGVYAMLGGSEVFPCICMSPLDPLTEKEKKLLKKQQDRKAKAAKKRVEEGRDEDDESGDEEDSDDEEEEEEEEEGEGDGEGAEGEEGDAEGEAEEGEDAEKAEAAEEKPEGEEGEKKKKKKKIPDLEFDLAPSVTLLSREEEDKLNAPPKDAEAVPPPPPPTEGEAPPPKPDSEAGEAKDSLEGSAAADAGAVAAEGEEKKVDVESSEKQGPAEEKKEEDSGGPSEEEKRSQEPAEDTSDVPIEKVRWMYETSEEGWKVYSVDASRELEEASRDGKSEHTLTIGKQVHKCKLETKKQTRDDVDGEFRIRRHVLGDGLAGMWEILTMKYEKPSGMYGLGVLKLLEKVWSQKETMSGKECGLGFMFLYSLFTGESRCKVSGGAYGEYGGGKSSFVGPFKYGGGSSGKCGGTSSNDSHRFALLLTQLYTDKHTKSLPASVINVLGRNRQVSLRMPKFKDVRKAQQTPFFNGWVDDQEPRSPLAELFSKLVPMMTVMKRKGAFHFPPPPPHLELPSPPASGVLLPAALPDWVRPELSDYGCEQRTIAPIGTAEIAGLISEVQYRLSTDSLKPSAPIHVEDSSHFDMMIKSAPEKLYIVYFHANWCAPCKSLSPVYRILSLQNPTAIFLKIDIDEVDDLVTRFEIDMMPTVLFLRGSPERSATTGCIKGGGPEFLVEFPKMLNKVSTEQELIMLKNFHANTPGKNISTILQNISCSSEQISKLALQPLLDCNPFVTRLARTELGMKPVNPDLAFDVNKHEAAQTAPAVSVLNRFKDDVTAYATYANTAKVVKVVHLSDRDIHAYFDAAADDATRATAENSLTQALTGVRQLIAKLYEIRDKDAQMVQDTIPMIECAANWVPSKGEQSSSTASAAKTRFLLNRIAGQNAFVWVEFLFGMLLSSKGEEDLLKLNPYLSAGTVTAIMHLVTMSMLRANRLGHTNRCIGTAISLESLLAKTLKLSRADRVEEGKVLIPKLVQVGEELAKTITLARHYMTESSAGLFGFDPRYLVFEFVWNIQLRQKQVEIVNDFRSNLAKGTSKVKQMIMGAGKTSVVAPLLALIVADGKSLVLSVVPKALVEMSRTRMRETFAAIMVKRIYTLDFDRSTTVTPSMRRSLENAAANRGVVVATPTTLKSIMLSYIETLQQIRDAKAAGGMRMKLAELTAQAGELAKILGLFKEGVMLLDEVDLILHPLKSELNFPIGDKFDLDGSDEGERWGLPIHLLDALFFNTTGRVSTFEQRGVALDILKRISATIQQGIQGRHLQRLPHVTLLNYEFYNECMKPVMAEWAYLWLQKNHLHGIDRAEAVQYLLEGAAARSDTSTKITMLELAIAKIMVSSGQKTPGLVPTLGYQRSMTAEELAQKNHTLEELRLKAHTAVDEDAELEHLLSAQGKQLEAAKEAALEHQHLVNSIYEIDEELEENNRVGSRKLGELQGSMIVLHKKIAELECPRDDSLDNSIVVWYSQAFAIGSGAVSDSSSGTTSGESSVPTICSLIEDMGMTVKRCCDAEEATRRARDLQEEGLLRCLIVGGEERGMSCGPSCVKKHSEKECMRCGQMWESHVGHECAIGGRGTWAVEQADAGEKKVSALQMMKSLTDVESAYARAHAPLPAQRTAVYSAHSSMKEDERMDFWKLGTTVTDDSKQLIAWVNAMPGWKASEETEEETKTEAKVETKTVEPEDAKKPFVRPTLRRQSSNNEKSLLAQYKEELEALEARKAAAGDDDEVVRKRLLLQVTEKHAALDESVRRRIAILSAAAQAFQGLIRSCSVDNSLVLDEIKNQYVGPHCGREASLAMGWLEVTQEKLNNEAEKTSTENKAFIARYSVSVNNELSFLKQMALAAKVVAHVTSPMHKKLLNLCHNWLSTFLPHCLAKVNRVSFGLLSMEDCKAALLADPHVPRSRLKLGVPFVGKDVPSKSSEFAHPDVIIGLTVLAYRYTGLRKDDFVDIIDSMTAQFYQEIGPARDRESSQRHEKWVFAAGGAIRGLKTTREGQTWTVGPDAGQDELNSKEVVQLKFLQKSNKEQMDKLFELIRYEPLVIHYYLQRTIFPMHMRSQRMKISASGQAVGGDMLVGKRVGFSGTPSDLLPQELGRCDYETGDDGMMLTTCLDRNVTSYEFIEDRWTVELLLERIATTESPRYHALIDTGALITGYSNQEVAQQLLDRGLTWCEGVVFLDDDDKQQVLVRATGRVVSADQCGVSLERRFAFYDQIHTTGMDIKHVVNATAVITLGKDMVFRDYVQGAYRMRGIGVGQRVHVYIIPEVKELMQRELRDAVIPAGAAPELEVVQDHVLEDVVAWLVVNSLRSEQTQWTMLCLQNIGNLYRKNAFKCLTAPEVEDVTGISNATGLLANLSKEDSLKVFDESIDFSLEAGVPDPLPFEKKLRSMLDEHEAFLLPEQHQIGHSIMEVVGQFSMIEGSANRLDTEQEREQEQEQEKEVEARRDQQIEVEKFVDREFSRQEEVQRPWAFKTLAQPLPVLSSMTMPPDHPFYRLKDFKLRHHEPLEFPDSLLVSSNYFNPNWTGLRRVKNVVMVLEFAPSSSTADLRLKTRGEDQVQLTETQRNALRKAHSLLGFHAGAEGNMDYLAREDLRHAVHAFTDDKPSDELLDSIIQQFSKEKVGYLSFDEFAALLTSGILHPQHVGRYYVAVSLAEAETIRRILHIRKRKDPHHAIPNCSTELALRYSPMSTPGAPPAGDGGVIFDASAHWHTAKGTSATPFEAAVAHSSYRFFDCDMHFSLPALNVLVRSLHGSTRDRERFFFSTVGCRRRMERKWQETPLAKVFTVPDEWAALKQQAQAVFIIEALKARNLTLWEAFSAFDYDNNGILAPSEFYGALRWLGVPNLTAEDVVDFIEAADTNNDGMVDYKEYMDMLSFAEDSTEGVEEEKSEASQSSEGPAGENKVPIAKVEPYGAEVLREIMVHRRQLEQARIREERQRKQAYHDALDVKVFEEELEASRLRKGGANPAVLTLPEGPRKKVEATTTTATEASGAATDSSETTDASAEADVSPKCQVCVTDFRFSTNQHPLRFVATGKSNFLPVHFGTAADPPIRPMRCAKNHVLGEYNYYWMDCERCRKRGTMYVCWPCYKFFCTACYEGERRSKELDRRDASKHPTYLRCLNACSFSLQVPLAGGACPTTGKYTLSMELRFEKLPLKGSMQSLLRFSLPDLNQARKMHRTSVYLNGDGIVVGRPLETGGGVEVVAPEPVPVPPAPVGESKDTKESKESKDTQDNEEDEEEAKEAPKPKKAKPTPSGVVKVRPGRWAVISISVEPEEGTLSTYIDGKLCHQSTDLDPADLRLHHKVVVLGGGKQAHMRGGDIRRLVIHGTALHGSDIMDVYHRLANDHPGIGGRAVRIQAIFRGFIMRKRRDEEIAKNKAEFLKEKEEEEKAEADAGAGDSAEGEEKEAAEEGKEEDKAAAEEEKVGKEEPATESSDVTPVGAEVVTSVAGEEKEEEEEE